MTYSILYNYSYLACREAGYEATKMQLVVEEDAEDPKMLIMKSKSNGCLGPPSSGCLQAELSHRPLQHPELAGVAGGEILVRDSL